MNSGKNCRLVLFDVDQTLIKSIGRAHDLSYRETFKNIFGIDASSTDIEPFGKTERRIFIEVLRKHGIPQDVINSRLDNALEHMSKSFKKNFEAHQDIELNEGVRELLDMLKESGFFLGIVTGNLESIARIKLARAGIEDYFSVGAFGDRFESRSLLVDSAIKEAERIVGQRLNKNNIFVVGDSFSDILAGKECGVKTIGVATGNSSIDTLGSYHPDFIIKNFENPREVLNIFFL